MNVSKRHAGRLANSDEDLSRFVQNQHIGFEDAAVLLVILRLRCIAEAVGLQRMQDLDFADRVRDQHFAHVIAESRDHSGL